MLTHPLAVLFDPEATMNVNGVPRKEFGVKLAVAAFVAIAPVLGSVIVFTPTKKMAGWLLRFDSWAKGFVAQRMNRK